MPNIRTYENTEQLTARLNPDTKVVAGNAALTSSKVRAETLSNFGQEVGGAVKYFGEKYQEHQAQREISQGLATSAEILANTTESWNNTAKNADPNNPATADKWREENLEPILQAWVSGFSTERGKAWAEAQVGSMRNHFFEKTAADQSVLAGSAVAKNLRTFIDSATRTVQSDVSTTTTMLGTVDTAVEAILQSNPNLTVAQQTQIRDELTPAWKKEIALNAGQAIARGDPTLAQTMLSNGTMPGEEHLDAGDKEKLYGFAASMKNAAETDARQARATAIQEGKMGFEKKLITIAPRLNDGGQLVYPSGYAQALEELKTDPYADLEKLNSAGQAYQAAVKEDLGGVLIASDPVTRAAFTDRISSATNPLTDAEVYDARARGLLGKDDFSLFLGAAQGPGAGGMTAAQKYGWSRLKDLKSRYRPIVAGSAGPLGLTPLGAARWAEFSNYIDNAYIGFTGQMGKTPEDAIKQIQTDMDVISQRYAVMGPDAMRSTQNFMRGTPDRGAVPAPGASKGRSATHSYEALAGTPAAAGPKIKPGESAAEFLKRTRGQ